MYPVETLIESKRQLTKRSALKASEHTVYCSSDVVDSYDNSMVELTIMATVDRILYVSQAMSVHSYDNSMAELTHIDGIVCILYVVRRDVVERLGDRSSWTLSWSRAFTYSIWSMEMLLDMCRRT